MSKNILVIPGDGIGKEITDSAVTVLNKVAAKFGLDFHYEYRDAGGTAYDKYGTPLPFSLTLVSVWVPAFTS